MPRAVTDAWGRAAQHPAVCVLLAGLGPEAPPLHWPGRRSPARSPLHRPSPPPPGVPPPLQVQKSLLETSRRGYLAAMSASSYSFVSLMQVGFGLVAARLCWCAAILLRCCVWIEGGLPACPACREPVMHSMWGVLLALVVSCPHPPTHPPTHLCPAALWPPDEQRRRRHLPDLRGSRPRHPRWVPARALHSRLGPANSSTAVGVWQLLGTHPASRCRAPPHAAHLCIVPCRLRRRHEQRQGGPGERHARAGLRGGPQVSSSRLVPVGVC